MLKKITATFIFLGISGALATTPAPVQLHYQTGNIPILNGQATLNTSTNLRYLNAEEARSVIVNDWGNPPDTATGVLGMIVPVGQDLLAKNSWAVVVTEAQDGHVKDTDAASMNYDKLLNDLRRGEAQDNAAREKAGYPTAHLVGWADTPRYDAVTHKMYWAQELAFKRPGEPEGEHTLNYAVRMLGRDNVLELNAVAGMGQLPQVKQGMQSLLQQVSFNPGHRYEDFNASTDKVAQYGIAGLLGVVAAKKLGLLAGLLLLLKKGGVVLLGGLAALGRLFKRREA